MAVARCELERVAMKSSVTPKQETFLAAFGQKVAESMHRQIRAGGIVDGTLTKSVELPAGASVRVVHGLKRKPRGWIVVDATGAAPSIYRESWDDSAIVFQSAAAASAAFWVF